MHRKIVFLFLTLAFFFTGSFAQTVNENINKRAKDPQTAENAAKADVYIIRNKRTIDSLEAVNNTPPAERKKGRKAKKTCRGKK